jgi:hypothetical protein
VSRTPENTISLDPARDRGDATRDGDMSLRRSAIALAILFVLAWLTQISPPLPTGTPDLDDSWRQVLGYARTHGWRFGTDIVFTYGPFGYFLWAPYDPALYGSKVLGFELAFKLALAFYVALAARDVRGWIARGAYAVGLLFLLRANDAYFFVCTIAIALSMLGERLRPRDALVLALLAVISLSKSTYLALVALAMLLVVLHRGWAHSWKSASRVIAMCALVFALVWTLAGQSLFDLPRFLQTAAWIARGYNQGMGSPAPARASLVASAMVALAIAVAALNLAQAPRSKALRSTAWTAAAMIACGLFVALKAGLVRYTGSSISFFGFAAVAPCLLVRRADVARPALRAVQTAAAVGCTLLGVCGYAIALDIRGNVPAWLAETWIAHARRSLVRLADARADRARLERGRAELQSKYDLPRMRAHIGRESVDVLGYSQGIALLNRFDYRPRPVFQSYSAYTPELIELNARYLESAAAPRFIVSMLEIMDGKLPGSEDGLALQVMLRDYRPVTCERGYLLLERTRRGASPEVESERVLVLERTLALGETFEMPVESDAAAARACFVVSLDIGLTLAGELRSLARKAPPLEMRCELDDGAACNARIAPGLVRTGVLVSPFLSSQDACLRWYAGERAPRVVRFSVNERDDARGAYAPTLAVRVYRDEALAAHVDPGLAGELVYGMFSIAPDSVTAALRPDHARIDDHEALVVEPPSEIAFALAPGDHSLHASFGILPDTCARGVTDGAGFSVATQDAFGVERALFREVVDKDAAGFSRVHTLDVRFTTAGATKLLLRTDAGPRGDARDDRTYWADVIIRGEW